MEFVIFSDIHLHEWSYGASYNEAGVNTRLLSLQKVMDDILQYCLDREVKQVLFCGDLFHTQTKVSTQALKVAFESFRKFKQRDIQLHCILGNHDIATKSRSIHSLVWARDVCHLIETTPEMFDANGVTISAMSFSEDEDEIKRFLDEHSTADIMMIHQGVKNVPMGSGIVLNEILSPEMIPDTVRQCFAGHYHMHKTVSRNLTIVGSTTQQTWADSGSPRGWIHYNVDTNKIKHIESDAPKFIEQDYLHPTSMVARGNFIRMLNVPEEDKLEVRKKLKEDGALAIEFISPQDKKDSQITEYKVSVSLEKVLEDFTKNLPKDRIEVGNKLRSNTYEIDRISG